MPHLSIYLKDLRELYGADEGHQPSVFKCLYLSVLARIHLKNMAPLSEAVLPCPALSTMLRWIFKGMQNAGNEQAFVSIPENRPRGQTLRRGWALAGAAR